MRGAAARSALRLHDLIQEGLHLQRTNRLPEAAQRYERALQIDPRSFDALQLLGTLRFRAGDGQAGIRLLERALALQPDHAPTINNLGNALRAAGRLPEALLHYERALRFFPEPVPPVVLRNLGSALLEVGDAAQAEPLLREAAARDPNDAVAWCWLGHLARALRRAGSAVDLYKRALHLQPDLLEARRGLGSAHRDLHEYRNAAAAFAATLAVQPDYLLALISKADAELAMSDWAGFTAAVRTTEAASPQPGHMINPMMPMLFTDDPATLRRYADAHSALHLTQSTPRGAGHPRPERRGVHSASRIRVGYLSADLREHPVGRLLAGVVESHDRSTFDIQLWSIERDDGSAVHRRLASAAELVSVGALSDVELAARLRDADLDVLIDLMGYTEQNRARILAARVAPVQACWLGYPGTLGGPLADYLIADGYTISPEQERHYAEHIVRLPDCLLPGDRAVSAGESLARTAYGLPTNAVVLCSFNQIRKLNPLTFDIWMEALRENPEAVLWLSEGNAESNANLRRAAGDRGVDAERLVFAPRLPSRADHLARYSVADLALDTFPYGSHSTAIDALWAGCPLVAWVGRSLPARVSGSVLSAAGLPALIANSAEEYRALITSLARDSARRSDLRARLIATRHQCALFDVQRFTRALEHALLEMTRRSKLGQAPEHLWIQ